MKVIAKTAIEHNGIVYGGYVRDTIRNSHSPNTINPPSSDIDIFMANEYLADFVLEMNLKNINFRRMPTTTVLSEYLPSHTALPYSSDFTHRRYMATLDASFWKRAKDGFLIPLDISSMIEQCEALEPIAIDIVTSDTEARSPFVTAPDFQCNALFIDKYGLQVCPDAVEHRDNNSNTTPDILSCTEQINKIVSDIVSGTARLIQTNRPRNGLCARIQKMIHKTSWTILDQCISTVRDDAYSGHCLMCHDSLCESPTHLKFTCCDGRYHARCMNNLIAAVDSSRRRCARYRTFNCPLCRQSLELYGAAAELLPSLVSLMGIVPPQITPHQ
jgi:hypothetical protein